MEQGLTRAQIITELTRSTHRDLRAYLPVGRRAAQEDPDFFAHLIAWNHHKGDIRDSKIALPLVQLTEEYHRQGHPLFLENALAHLADLNARMLVRAYEFYKEAGAPKNLLQRFIRRWLRDLEGDDRAWDHAALQHKASLTRLYGLSHMPTSERIKQAWGWKRTDGSRPERRGKFAVVKTLGVLPALEIAGTIDRYKLPWLIVRGALGARVKEPDVLMAIVDRMTPTDLVTSAKWLVKAGVKDHAVTRAAFEQALARAVKPPRGKKKPAVLKAGRTAKVLRDVGEEQVAGKLEAVQEKQLEQRRTIEGNWLILGDKSGSMQTAIVVARRIAAILGRLVKGEVHLVFFDSVPRYVGDVSGKSLAAIELTTATITANGGTSIGCGVEWARDRKLPVDGIVVVSDGGERHPPYFTHSYQRYCQQLGRVPTVYFYEVGGQDPDVLSVNARNLGIDLQHFNLRQSMVDDESLLTLAQTMRVGRYDLGDEILSMRLRTLDEVLTRTVGQEVFRGQQGQAV